MDGRGHANCSAVNSNTVILVVNIRSTDRNARAIADVKPICVGPKRIASGAINSDSSNCKVSATIDAEDLHRWVEDVDVGDGGRDQIMCLEELGLGLATVGALSIPPVCTVAVKVGSAGLCHGNIGSRNGEERARPEIESDFEPRL